MDNNSHIVLKIIAPDNSVVMNGTPDIPDHLQQKRGQGGQGGQGNSLFIAGARAYIRTYTQKVKNIPDIPDRPLLRTPDRPLTKNRLPLTTPADWATIYAEGVL